MIHSGHVRDVPPIEVSVESGSLIKHCREKRRPIQLHSQSTHKKKKAQETLIKIL